MTIISKINIFFFSFIFFITTNSIKYNIIFIFIINTKIIFNFNFINIIFIIIKNRFKYFNRRNIFIYRIKIRIVFICYRISIKSIIYKFFPEKIISYIEYNNSKKFDNNENNHEHHDHEHNHNHSNIIISLVGDFIHNLTDGMAIGAGFNKNIKVGVNLSLSIFFHEIPHEIGDFSYLLKQNMSMTNSVISQMITALGSFLGVFLSFKFGEEYSDKILAFASGAFLYLALNTIMGDLKNTKSIIHIILEGISFIFGVYILDCLV